MIHPRFGAFLLLGTLAWVAGFIAFTWLIDPYGVSPIRLNINRVNNYRPARLDIDRLIKPYEVWRYQPKTVFLGTSRIHQSIDPSVLNGTMYEPAYNASVPAVSLGMSLSYLRHYAQLDPALRIVIVELFFRNFTGQGQERTDISLEQFAKNTWTLFFSANTMWASLQTVFYNLMRKQPAREIKPGGFHYYPPGHDTKGVFASFPWGIWQLNAQRTGPYKLHEPAFDTVKELAMTAKANGLEIVFFLTPSHAYDDFYLEYVGAWDVIEEWLMRVSSMGKVYSFSQPNSWVYESVGDGMRYWNDPYHFSLEMGRGMQLAWMGKPLADQPENFMVLMTPDKVSSHVAQRRAAIKRWAVDNQAFVERFHEERRKWEAGRHAPKPDRH